MQKSIHSEKLNSNILLILALTILAHAAIIAVKIDFSIIMNVDHEKKYQPVEIIDLQKFQAIKRSKIIKKVPSHQIVNTDQEGKNISPETSRFLGKSNQTFDRQTIANKVSSYKKAGKGSSRKAKKSSSKLQKLSLSNLGNMPIPEALKKDAALKTVGLRHGDKNSKGLAANNDFIEDVPLGDVTRLNTVEYKYFGFYERIRKKLEQYWGQSLSQRAKELRSRGRTIASNENFITSLIINLNDKGEIIKVKMLDGSGLKEFDDAAVESFNKAGPFPNPPKGMLKNGIAEIKWSFVVKS